MRLLKYVIQQLDKSTASLAADSEVPSDAVSFIHERERECVSRCGPDVAPAVPTAFG